MVSEQNFDASFSEAIENLNAAQKLAVETIEGPVLVIAGPGTGKTQIIAARIGNILKQTDTAPQNILCLTYTDAGAVAMRKRLLQFIGPTAYRVQIHTFHSFCNDVIQSNLDYFQKRNLEPISDLENIQLMHGIIDDLPLDSPLKKFAGDIYYEEHRLKNLFKLMKDENWTPEFVEQKANEYLNDLPLRDEYIYKRKGAGYKKGDVKTKDIEKQKEKMLLLTNAAKLFPLYQQRMLDLNRYDYSDMLLWVIKAFRENEFMLRIYQERFQYFLVDEFQDTNGAQNEILKALCDYWDTPNVFAVGDDDQCVYEFQGARMKNIQEFENRYGDQLKKIVLTENYRSTQAILDAAKNLIENNLQRIVSGNNKLLVAADPEKQKSKAKPQLVALPNVAQEEAYVVTEIERLKNEGVNLSEIAILYHRHAHAENITNLLQKKEIPFRTRRNINILDEPLIQNIITLFRFIEAETRNPHSGEHHLFEMMHFSFFGIDVRDIASMSVYLDKKRIDSEWRTAFSLPQMMKEVRLRNPDAIEKLNNNLNHWIAECNNITVQMLFGKVLNESGLLSWTMAGAEKLFQLQVIHTFFNFIKEENHSKPRMKLSDFLETIDLMDSVDLGINLEKTVYRNEAVQFITAHSAKGLEFEHVYVIGGNKENWEKATGRNSGKYQLPDTIVLNDDINSMESVRRLFYVACTRAKEFLTITYANNDAKEKPIIQSQFVTETGIETREEKLENENLTQLLILSLKAQQPINIQLIEKEVIEKRLEHFSLSASALNKYLQCPVAFYFENVLRVPAAKSDHMTFGNAIHFALKRAFEKMMKNKNVFEPVEDLITDFKWFMNNNADSFTEKQFLLRLEHGKNLITNYYNKMLPGMNRNVRVEYRIVGSVVNGVPLNGSVDKVEFISNHEVNVVDYKTGNVLKGKAKLTAPNEKNPNGGDYWRQLVFYKILIESSQRENWNVLSGEINFIEPATKTDDPEKVKLMISPADMATVKHQILDSYTKIKQQQFNPGCGDKDCNWCNFVRNNNLIVA